MDSTAIHIQNLSYRYEPGVPCLENINLDVDKGESFGLFGPNGAGKSTLMFLLTGILAAEQGEIKILGKDLRNNKNVVKKSFGFVPQNLSFYQQLSPVENLEFFGAWYGMSRKAVRQQTGMLLEVLGLTRVKNKAVKTFSGGMKRRVNLAIGVLHDPSVLFLDEPTVGVDVQTRHAIMDYLKKLNTNGTTLVYTSHNLNEAQNLCDRIALIDHGRILVHDHLSVLLNEYQADGLENLFISLTGKEYRD